MDIFSAVAATASCVHPNGAEEMQEDSVSMMQAVTSLHMGNLRSRSTDADARGRGTAVDIALSVADTTAASIAEAAVEMERKQSTDQTPCAQPPCDLKLLNGALETWREAVEAEAAAKIKRAEAHSKYLEAKKRAKLLKQEVYNAQVFLNSWETQKKMLEAAKAATADNWKQWEKKESMVLDLKKTAKEMAFGKEMWLFKENLREHEKQIKELKDEKKGYLKAINNATLEMRKTLKASDTNFSRNISRAQAVFDRETAAARRETKRTLDKGFTNGLFNYTLALENKNAEAQARLAKIVSDGVTNAAIVNAKSVAASQAAIVSNAVKSDTDALKAHTEKQTAEVRESIAESKGSNSQTSVVVGAPAPSVVVSSGATPAPAVVVTPLATPAPAVVVAPVTPLPVASVPAVVAPAPCPTPCPK